MPSSQAVLVGIDGSPSSAAAALWAIEEASARDLPLRLIHVVAGLQDPRSTNDADALVHEMLALIHTRTHAVRCEAHVLRGEPVDVLIQQSRTAAMLCLGSVGRRHGGIGRLGSTAAALPSRTNCAVAIIHSDSSQTDNSRWVVAEVGEFPTGDGVLGYAVEEAMLRRRPLRVVATWPSRYPDVYDNRAQAAKARMVRAAWQRHLTPFRAHHSQLDVRVEATPGNILNYLARQRHRIGLAVVPGIRATGIAEFLDVSRDAGAADLCFDVLICAPSCPNYVA